MQTAASRPAGSVRSRVGVLDEVDCLGLAGDEKPRLWPSWEEGRAVHLARRREPTGPGRGAVPDHYLAGGDSEREAVQRG